MRIIEQEKYVSILKKLYKSLAVENLSLKLKVIFWLIALFLSVLFTLLRIVLR